jgi:hypothetical protein
MSIEYPIMSSILWWVTLLNNLNDFLDRHTPSEQSISIDSEEVRWIPYVETTFINEFSFLFPWWYMTCNHKIDNIRVPRVWFGYLEEHIIPQRIINRQFLWILKLHSRQVIRNSIFYSLFIFYF